MAQEKTYTFQEFTLHSEVELDEAKKEAEAIKYIRSKADLGDVQTALRVYNRLVEKKTLVTVVGVSFLQELRTQILSAGVVAESSLLPLPKPKQYPRGPEQKKLTKEQKLIEYYRDKSKNQRILILALCVGFVALFFIRLFGTSSPFWDYEKKVLDEYGGWRDELVQKEQELHAWEEELTQKGQRLAAWEEELAQKEEQFSAWEQEQKR